MDWSRLYEFLTRNDRPQPSDLIVVLAGRMDRKQYGLDLYRAGIAPRLLLSIGRYEVRRMGPLCPEAARELEALRDRTPPEERHFFCEFNASGMRIEKARLRRWSTYGEALAIRDYAGPHMPARLTVVSTDIHLRRAAMTFARVFRGFVPEIRYCPVPPAYTDLSKDTWWNVHRHRRYVFTEAIKLAGYRAILIWPDWVVRRAMRLRD